MPWSRGTIYDVIGSADLATGGGNLWSARTGDHRVFAWWLPGVDSAWFCRCRRRYVVISNDGSTGALCCSDRHDQLSDSVVNYRLRLVRRHNRIANKAPSLNSAVMLAYRKEAENLRKKRPATFRALKVSLSMMRMPAPIRSPKSSSTSGDLSAVSGPTFATCSP